jgi:ABC-type transporter Mla subunit MlaD
MISAYQFRTDQGPADQIVQNFGIAIASTIAGIALRIFFNQMRRDPIEVEQTARLELADAARKVKRELESTVLEFSYFRRATQQSLAEAVEEIHTQLKDANDRIVGQLDEFAAKSSKPLEEASKKSGDTIVNLADAVGGLSQTTEQMIKSLESVVAKLKALQTPEEIIEIKLSPMIQGLTRAVNSFGKYVEEHAKSVDDNLKRTQEVSTNLADLVTFIRAARARAERAASAPDMSRPGGPSVNLGEHDVRGPNA